MITPTKDRAIKQALQQHRAIIKPTKDRAIKQAEIEQ